MDIGILGVSQHLSPAQHITASNTRVGTLRQDQRDFEAT